MKFGNIPEEVLGIMLHYYDEDHMTLAHILVETTDQDIEKAKYVVSATEDGLDLLSFTAWTKDHVLSLVHTSLGVYMVMNDRNPNE